MKDSLSALILTYNEEPNIGRSLEKLRWMHEVVIIDSDSTDRTLEIASSFNNTRVLQRAFDVYEKP